MKKITYNVLFLNCRCLQSLTTLNTSASLSLTQSSIPTAIQSPCQLPPTPSWELESLPKHRGNQDWWDITIYRRLLPGLFLRSKKCLWAEMVNQHCASARITISPHCRPCGAPSPHRPALTFHLLGLQLSAIISPSHSAQLRLFHLTAFRRI